MKKIIASIKLAPGNRGYFDPLTGINLTISNSIGYIREDDDVSNIRKAIREGKVKIVGGQLPPAINNIKPVKEVKKEKPVEIKKEKIEVITPVVEDKKQPKIDVNTLEIILSIVMKMKVLNLYFLYLKKIY